MSAIIVRSRESWLRGLFLLGFLLVWQWAAVVVNKPLLPAPTVVLSTLLSFATLPLILAWLLG